MNRFILVGFSVTFLGLSANDTLLAQADSVDVAPSDTSAFVNSANQPATSLPALGGAGENAGAAPNTGSSRLKPMVEGPLHEAFLSPAKDREPLHIDKAPPASVTERPGIDPPDPRAEWIEGYWEWDSNRSDFVWVTGSWRVPPPGRFWVNGYWKRDAQGWYRVSGFWSDRRTDRVDYRKNGPPEDRPDDEPGEPPADDCFYVPGQYYPDGDGVVWKKGFWSKVQAGWAWVPAQWVRQPEGWLFQDGFWDRTLEDRGTLFAPATVERKDEAGATNNDLTYQPYTTVSPELYGQLNGAFGRPNSNYDGYPGITYDETGRYYGYASYGTLGCYYGYLDYPFYGGYGYPYYATPVVWGDVIGAGIPFSGYEYGLCGGVLGGMFGFGYGAYPVAFGVGLSYPWYGAFGYPGFGWGGLGWGGYWDPWWGGLGFGWGGLGWGGLGWGGVWNPWWGGPCWGWGGWGGGGWAHRGWNHRYPFHPGRRGGGGGGHRPQMGNRGFNPIGGNPNRGNMVNRPGFNGNNIARRGHRGIQAPPSSRAFGNPFRPATAAHNPRSNNAGARSQAAGSRSASVAGPGSGWRPAYNGVRSSSPRIQHSAARPAFSNTTGATPGTRGQTTAGANFGGANRLQGAMNGQQIQGQGMGRGQLGAGRGSMVQGGQGSQSFNPAGAGLQRGQGPMGAGRSAASGLGSFSQPNRAGGAMGGGAAMRPGGGYSGTGLQGGFSAARPGGGLGSGFTGGGGRMGGGFSGAPMGGGGGFSGARMGGGFGGGPMGGMGGGGMGGGRMGGMGGGMGGGGMGGGHGGGGRR